MVLPLEVSEATVYSLLLALTRQHSVQALLEQLVTRLSALEPVALARVWTIEKGDLCEVCPERTCCADRSRCLHLQASAGRPQVDSADWSRTGGRFRRIPLGERKVGTIALTGQPITVEDIEQDPGWIVDTAWAAREGIRAFAGQPLLLRRFDGQAEPEILGVLGLFLRSPLTAARLHWLQVIAEHAAACVANARAFEQIERLQLRLEKENTYLREEVRARQLGSGIIGNSPALRAVLDQIALVAASDTSVLISGETGTGKELVAAAIHEQSLRRRGPLVRVNCAAIPRELFESAFFGHARGAFTGAIADRPGRFELADGGTLFLDEVVEIPLEQQGKLLRVLQEGTFERVGEVRSRSADVRLIAASNRDLPAEVRAGRFREDLFYRLQVFPIPLPPLRARAEDLAPLARHFLSIACRRLGLEPPALGDTDLCALQAYSWPGNVRELQNVVERAALGLRRGCLEFRLPQETTASPISKQPEPPPGGLIPYPRLRQLERVSIEAALRRASGKLYGPAGAAELLAIKPTTLASKMKALGIRKQEPGL